MSLERKILDFLAATLVAMDGARSGPLQPPLAHAELHKRVVGPVLASVEAAAFRMAIERLALFARARLAEGLLDPTILSAQIAGLTRILLDCAGAVDPVATALAQAKSERFDVDLCRDLLQTSFDELRMLDGYDLGLDSVPAPEAVPSTMSVVVPPAAAEVRLPAPAFEADDILVLEPDDAAPMAIQPLEPTPAKPVPVPISVAPSLPLPEISAPKPQPVPAVPDLPSSPMVAAIAARHRLAEIGLLRIAQHPAVAAVSLQRLETVLEHSAGLLRQLVDDLARRAQRHDAQGQIEQQAQTAIIDGEFAAADALLSGLEARVTTAVLSASGDGDAARQARRLIAEVLALRASLAEACLDHGDAAGFYGSAVAALLGADTEMAWLYALRQGTALQTAFEYLDDPQNLERAVIVYAQAVEAGAPNGLPLPPGLATLWVLTQNSLGNALAALGERNADIDRFRLAAWSYGQALVITDRSQTPAEWALLHANQANALFKVAELAGQPGSGQPASMISESLTTAIANWGHAAEAFAQRYDQDEHFKALMHRAIAQTRLAFVSKDHATLHAAVEGLAMAAAATPAKALPGDRITIASHLGDACSELAEVTGERAWLDRAVDAYEAAFELVATASEERGSVWAGAATNLANALWNAGRSAGNRDRLVKADTLFASAAAAFERDGAAQPAAAIHSALAELRDVLSRMQTGWRPLTTPDEFSFADRRSHS